MAEVLSGKRLEILDYISTCLRERGYPPSVREIGTAVGLASSATVHSHLASAHIHTPLSIACAPSLANSS